MLSIELCKKLDDKWLLKNIPTSCFYAVDKVKTWKWQFTARKVKSLNIKDCEFLLNYLLDNNLIKGFD